MVKDAPNYVPMKLVGLAQTSREILEYGDVLIFPVVLTTLKNLRYTTATLRDHIIHLVRGDQ